jgi:Trypsin-like peptidase domain
MDPSALPFDAIYRVICDSEYRPIGTAFAWFGEGVLCTAAHVGAEIKNGHLLIDHGDRKPVRTAFLGLHQEHAVAWIRTAAEHTGFVRFVGDTNRVPVVGEEVFVLGYPSPAERADRKLFASPRVCRSTVMAQIGHGDGRRIELQGPFPRGFSGAPVLAASDGAILGMLDAVGFAPLADDAPVGFHLGLVVPTDLLAA